MVLNNAKILPYFSLIPVPLMHMLPLKNLISISFLLLMSITPCQADDSEGLSAKDIPVIMSWATETITNKAKKNNLSTHVSERQRAQSPNALVTHINEYVATRMPEDEYIAATKSSIDGELGVEIKITEVFPFGLSKTEINKILKSKKENLAKNYCELMVDAQYPVQMRYGALTSGFMSNSRYDAIGYFEFGKDFCSDNSNLWKTGLRKIFNW